jgi:cytochrome c biogenesis protein CcdA
MRKIFMTLAVFALFFIGAPAAQAADDLDVVFFHGQGCGHCAKSEELLEFIAHENPEVKIRSYEVYFNDDYRDLMFEFGREYDVDVSGVPMIFVGNAVISGHKPDLLISTIERCLEIGCISALERVEASRDNGEAPPEEIEASEALRKLTIPAVISAAAVDAINPCAFAVLILLITAALAGLAFTASIFISYFLMGLGLYSAIAASGISRTFYIVIAVLAILIGLFNLKDFLWYGKWFVMEVPMSWRPTMKKLIGGVTSAPGAFFIGFLVSLFLLPCTSGPYIVILGLLAKASTRAAAIPLLLLYNFIFVLPMLLITLAIAKGMTTTQKAEEWRQGKLRILHLIAGIIILGLGLVMLGSVFLGHV